MVLWSLCAYSESTFFTMLSYLCDTSYSYFKVLLYEEVVVPVSSAYYWVVSFLFSYIIECSSWRLSLLLTIYSPSALSYSFTRFYNAPTYNLWAEAVFLSMIISALFSEMPVCISEHMRPYYDIVKVFLSILLANMVCWFYSVMQFYYTF